jgi:hypothetical protein
MRGKPQGEGYPWHGTGVNAGMHCFREPISRILHKLHECKLSVRFSALFALRGEELRAFVYST